LFLQIPDQFGLLVVGMNGLYFRLTPIAIFFAVLLT